MLDADFEDNLGWLADRYQLAISRRNGRWHLELYGPKDSWELGGSLTLHGEDLAHLIAVARDWAGTPESERAPGIDWTRLYEAAARAGKSTRELMQQGTQELLDRLDAE